MTNKEKPVSQVVKLVSARVDQALHELGGLNDNHLKFLQYYLTQELKCPHYHLRFDFRSTPKVLTIQIQDANWNPVWVKPKDSEILTKMVKYLKLDHWVFKFAERKNV